MAIVRSVSRLGLTLLIMMEFSECDQKIHIRKQVEFNSSMPKAEFRFVTLAIVIATCDGGVS